MVTSTEEPDKVAALDGGEPGESSPNNVDARDPNTSSIGNRDTSTPPWNTPDATPVTPSRQILPQQGATTPRSCLRGSRGTSSEQRRTVSFDDSLNSTRFYEPYLGCRPADEEDEDKENRDPNEAESEEQEEAARESDEEPEDASDGDYVDDETNVNDTDVETIGAELTRAVNQINTEQEMRMVGMSDGESSSDSEDHLDSLSDDVWQNHDDEDGLDEPSEDDSTPEPIPFEWIGLTNQQINELIFFGRVLTANGN